MADRELLSERAYRVEREEFEWMLKVDWMLSERTNLRLDEYLKSLPSLHDDVNQGVISKLCGSYIYLLVIR